MNLTNVATAKGEIGGLSDFSFICENCGKHITLLEGMTLEETSTSTIYKGKVSCNCTEDLPVIIIAHPYNNLVLLYLRNVVKEGFMWNPINVWMDARLKTMYRLSYFIANKLIVEPLSKLLGIGYASFRKNHF